MKLRAFLFFLFVSSLSFAQCPLVVGVNTTGAGSSSGNTSFTVADAVTMNIGDTASGVFVYMKGNGVSIIGFIYSDNSGQPGNLLGQSNGQTIATINQWYYIPFTSNVSVNSNNTVYWIAFQISGGGTGPGKDVVSWGRKNFGSTFATPVPNSSSWTADGAAKDSMYFAVCGPGPSFPWWL